MTDAEKKAAAKQRADAITAACAMAGKPDKAKAFIEDEEKSVADVITALTAEAEADKAKAEEDAAKAKASAGPESAEDAAKRVVAEERKRASDITAACALAKKPSKAAAFIADGKTLAEVVAALGSDTSAEDEPETNARHNAGTQPATSSWDKATASTNRRNGFRDAA